MLVEFYAIPELTTEKVAFYTVKLGESETKPTEYKEFVTRMRIKPANSFDLAELLKFIKVKIGNDGAIDAYFKQEGLAERIKQKTPDTYDPDAPDPKDYGLRLYCLRLSANVVVLFNGDRKWYYNPKNCERCRPYFETANKIAGTITEAMHNGDIYANGLAIDYNDTEGEDEFQLTI